MDIRFDMKEQIGQRVYTTLSELEIKCYVSKEPLAFDQRMTVSPMTLNIGDSWGTLFDCAWFELRGNIPDWDYSKKLVLQIDVGGEGLLFDAALNELTGITNKNSSYGIPPDKPGKWIYELDNYIPGEEAVFYVDASCNDLMGYVQNGGKITNASFALLDESMKSLYYDIEVIMDWYMCNLNISSNQPEVINKQTIVISDERKDTMKNILSEVSNLLQEITDENCVAAKAKLVEFYAISSDREKLEIFATGHAHLDIAWLWPIREGRRKAARTFATAINNINKYEAYIFGASQQQLFEFIKIDHPKLFDQIKQKVREGRFEIQGAFWVESDLNIPSGESLIRQIYYAKKFNLEEFGIEVDYLWEPDVFGFTASIPQILKKSGLKYMCSQKLSQNSINKFPHHSYKWIGNDDSTLLVHHFPENTYDSRARAMSAVTIANNYIEKEEIPVALMVYGVGDGGGGPGEEHIERLNRIVTQECLPKVKFSRVDTFLDAFSKYEANFPIIKGELYFERHQGTYTTEVLNKKGNRDMEYLLKEYEYLVTLNQTLFNVNFDQDQLDFIWKEVLLYQFHDIIPGSSIERVYKESRKRYQILTEQVADLIEIAYKVYLSKCELAGKYVIFNNTSIQREEYLFLNNQWHLIDINPWSVKQFEEKQIETPTHTSPSSLEVENKFIKVKFTNQGALYSLYDKVLDREFIDQARVGSEITIYHERAVEYAAWDFATDYRNGEKYSPEFLSLDVTNEGPIYRVKVNFKYKSSAMSLEYTLWDNSNRLDVQGFFDWKDTDCSVKIAYPITVEAREALCNIQYGNIYRPTHSDTSTDFAKDEVSAHHFVDICDENSGIALLSTCKYGFRVKDKYLEMTILRSQKKNGQEIGIEADQCYNDDNFGDLVAHKFNYALYTHAAVDKEYILNNEALKLNVPLRVIAHLNSGSITQQQFIKIESTKVIVEYVKPANRGRGCVVRLLNPTAEVQTFKLISIFHYKNISECNLQEEEVLPSMFDTEITMSKYEVKTFLLN